MSLEGGRNEYPFLYRQCGLREVTLLFRVRTTDYVVAEISLRHPDRQDDRSGFSQIKVSALI
jgi:hypothetical protein